MNRDEDTPFAPKAGTPRWCDRPPDADCVMCWPEPGYGYAYAETENGSRPIGKWKWSHIKGDCSYCCGAGLSAMPFSELGISWRSEDAQEWLKGKW